MHELSATSAVVDQDTDQPMTRVQVNCICGWFDARRAEDPELAQEYAMRAGGRHLDESAANERAAGHQAVLDAQALLPAMARASALKICPFCAEEIKAAAIKCRYCHSDLPNTDLPHTDLPHTDSVIASQSEPSEDDVLCDPEMPGVTITRRARDTVARAMAREDRDDLALRVALVPDGDELAYQFFFDERPIEGETITKFGDGVVVVIDPLSVQHLWGAHLDFVTTPHEGFTIDAAPDRSRLPLAVAAYAAPNDRSQYGQSPQPSTLPARPTWPHHGLAVPILQWKGMARMTRKETVPAYCKRCGFDWHLDSSVSNTIAQELGLAGRLQRGGKAMEQFGATYTVGASGRRIAAGNERQRMDDELLMLFALAACPSCQSTEVLLAKT